jgi:subtilisin family serine protease
MRHNWINVSIAVLIFAAIPGSRAGWAQGCSTPPVWASDGLRGGDRDRNRNGVEDVIENLDPASIFNVLLALNACPSQDDLARFGQSGTVGFVGRYLSVVQLSGVTVSQALALGSDPRVAMVDLERVGQAALNVTVPELLVRASPDYTPFTVEDSRPWITGAGIGIAVVDTGVDDGQHESLPLAIGGYNSVTHTELNPGDFDSHGTHMAGVVLGRGRVSRPGDLRGVAPGAHLIDVKVCRYINECPESQIMEGIEFAISRSVDWNIRVLYIGITIGIRSNGQDDISQMVNAAVANGLVAVVPAGNSGSQLIGRIAGADRAITVGATDDTKTIYRGDDTIGTFSSRGPRSPDGDSDISDEQKPDVVAPGRLIFAPRYDTVSLYTSKTGTSIAAAHVAGLAALMLQANPALTPAQVKKRIIDTAWRYLGGGWNFAAGWGLVDAYKAVP